MQVVLKMGPEWKRVEAALKKAPARVNRAIDMGTKKAAWMMVKGIVGYMSQGVPPPLAANTKRRRRVGGGVGARGTKPLIRSGDLRNSVTALPVTGGVFIGVPRASGSYNLALLHERGATAVIKITPKMRAFLFGVLFAGRNRWKTRDPDRKSTGIIVVKIPARPFIGPPVTASIGEATEFIKEHVFKALKLGR